MVVRATLAVIALLVATVPAQADPKVDYLLHCSGCHMPDGSGHAPVVPTLHDVIGRILAKPEGRDYVVRVPGVSQAPISDQKLTEVINWMLSEWNSSTLPQGFTPLTVREVAHSRAKLLADPLRYRAEHFPDL